MNPNPRIAEVLDSLGVAHLFKICDGAQAATDKFQPLQRAPGTTQADLVRNCLEAHRTLMAINADNARKFKDVAQFLAEDLKRKESPGAANGGLGASNGRQAVNGHYPFRFRMRSKSSVGSISIRPDSAPAGFASPTCGVTTAAAGRGADDAAVRDRNSVSGSGSPSTARMLNLLCLSNHVR